MNAPIDFEHWPSGGKPLEAQTTPLSLSLSLYTYIILIKLCSDGVFSQNAPAVSTPKGQG